MTRELLKKAYDELLYFRIAGIELFNRGLEQEIADELSKPPVGYAILDQEGTVIGVEREAFEADCWLRRNVPGRTIKPLYL